MTRRRGGGSSGGDSPAKGRARRSCSAMRTRRRSSRNCFAIFRSGSNAGRAPPERAPGPGGREITMIGGFCAIVILDLRRAWLARARLVAGLAQPLLYLFVLGAGIGGSSQLGGGEYRRYIFPGVLGLSLLFSATFAAIVIVFDRQIGFFKAVLVAPIPRSAIALGKIASGAIQAFVQGLVILPFAPLAGVPLSPLSVLTLVGWRS